MGRGASGVRTIRPVALGPLRYETHEVRHLLALHHQSLNVNPTFGSGVGYANRVPGLRGSLGRLGQLNNEIHRNTQAFTGAQNPSMVGMCVMGTFDRADAGRVNIVIENLATELLRYRSSIQLVGDPLMRAKHNSDLKQVLDEQEERARQLAEAGVMPPFNAIVRVNTARQAGIRVAYATPVCDRKMSWRVWESTAWNAEALRANQEACARDENRFRTGITIDDLWLVRQPSEQTALTHYLNRTR